MLVSLDSRTTSSGRIIFETKDEVVGKILQADELIQKKFDFRQLFDRYFAESETMPFLMHSWGNFYNG